MRLLLASCCCLVPLCAAAEQIALRNIEGTYRGFLVARDGEGHPVAYGDIYQVVHGDRITMRTTFHFKDGSLDDDTVTYTQHRAFRLVNEHHVQRGPFFPHPLETIIDARTGTVTIRTTGKDGKEQNSTQHMALPPDLANGMTSLLAKNLRPDTAGVTVPMLVALPKPRIVKIVYTAHGEDYLEFGGVKRKAMRFEMKIELGGVAGVVAPIIGKQPPPLNVWILEEPAPAFVKQTAFLFEDGPILTFELSSPVYPPDPDTKIVGGK